MLAEDVLVVDLDYRGWANLGTLLREVNAAWQNRELHILHKDGQVLHTWDSQRGPQPNPAERIEDPAAFARKLVESNDSLERVFTYEKDALSAASLRIYEYRPNLDLAAYLTYQFQTLVKDTPGVVVYPPLEPVWLGVPFQRWREKLAGLGTGHVVLAAFEDGELWTSLILGARQGMITLITTFDTLERYGLSRPAPTDSQRVVDSIEKQLGQVAAALFIERSMLVSLLTSSDRAQTLREAEGAESIYLQRDVERILPV